MKIATLYAAPNPASGVIRQAIHHGKDFLWIRMEVTEIPKEAPEALCEALDKAAPLDGETVLNTIPLPLVTGAAL
jgi:hypothetical protein